MLDVPHYLSNPARPTTARSLEYSRLLRYLSAPSVAHAYTPIKMLQSRIHALGELFTLVPVLDVDLLVAQVQTGLLAATAKWKASSTASTLLHRSDFILATTSNARAMITASGFCSFLRVKPDRPTGL